MKTPEEHNKLFDEILESIENEEKIRLHLFKAKLVKDKYQNITYLDEYVIGYYSYKFVKSLHVIKNLVDGCEYEIEYSTIKPYVRGDIIEYIDDNLYFNGNIILIDVPVEDYEKIKNETIKYLEINNISMDELKLCEMVEIITIYLIRKIKE